MQDDAQQGTVNLKSAVVVNETQFPELVHEEVDSGARGANHSREHLLRYVRKYFVRFRVLAIASEEQKSPSEPFLAGVEKLIDQVLLDSDIP